MVCTVCDGTDITRQHSKQEKRMRKPVVSRRDKSGVYVQQNPTASSWVPTSKTQSILSLPLSMHRYTISVLTCSQPTRTGGLTYTYGRIHRQVGFEPPATLPLRKLVSMFILAFGSTAAFSLVVVMRADDTASNDSLFGRLAGDRSPSGTLLGPRPLPPTADELPPPRDARACGDSWGMRLDLLRGLSMRMGPMFDLLRALLVAALGVSGPLFTGLVWCRSRALPAEVDEVLDSSEKDGMRFRLRSMSGETPRGEPSAPDSSSSARLPSVDVRERDLRKLGSRRLALGRLPAAPRIVVLADNDKETADDVEGAEKSVKSMLVSVFSSSHSLSDPPVDTLRCDVSAGIEKEAELASAGVTEMTTRPEPDAAPSPPSSRSPCPA